MEKVIKAKRITAVWLLLSLILTAASLFGIAVLSLKLMYVPLAICIAIAIAAIYAIPFLLISIKDKGLYLKILTEIENGADSIESISEVLRIKPDALRKIINKGIKKQYIPADKITA